MTDNTHHCRSDVGRERQINEDAWCADERLGLWAVFDGMGGHGGGDVASNLAATTVLVQVKAGRSLEEAFMAAHREILAAAASGKGSASMGCTAVGIQIHDQRYELTWVGDSRCYLLDEGGGLWQLSSDHSFVQRLIDDGLIDEEQAASHPERHVVSQCLGDKRGSHEPETISGELQPGQRLLLCSDGLNGELDDSAIQRILNEHPAPEAATKALIDAANNAGGADNITVAIVISDPGHGVDSQLKKPRRRGRGKTVPMGAAISTRTRSNVATAALLRKTRYFLGGVLGAAVLLLPLWLHMHARNEDQPTSGSPGSSSGPVNRATPTPDFNTKSLPLEGKETPDDKSSNTLSTREAGNIAILPADEPLPGDMPVIGPKPARKETLPTQNADEAMKKSTELEE